MKLKKFAAMMLAGVMAVSMLAGCAEGGKKEDDKDPVVTTGMTGSVIAALDEDTTKNVEFTAGSNLENVLKKAVQNAGYNGLDDINAKALNAIDSDISTKGQLENVGLSSDGSKETDKKESKATYVVTVAGEGKNEATIAKELADKVDSKKIGKASNKNVGWDELPEYSYTFQDDDDKDYWYAFDYTADIAVVDVSNAITGETTYVVAVTVTRTPTETYKSAK